MNNSILRFFEIRSLIKYKNIPLFSKKEYLSNTDIKSSFEYLTLTNDIYYEITVNIGKEIYKYKLTESLKERGKDVFYLRNNMSSADTKEIRFKSLKKEDFIVDYFYNLKVNSVSLKDKKKTRAIFDNLQSTTFKEKLLPYEIKVFPQLNSYEDLKNMSICYEVPNPCTFSELYIYLFEQE